MERHRVVRTAAVVAAAALVGALVVGCAAGRASSTGAVAPPESVPAAAPVVARSAEVDRTTVGAVDPTTAVVCEQLLAVDAVPIPDSAPPGEVTSASVPVQGGGPSGPDAHVAFAAAVLPHLQVAREAAPPDLAAHLGELTAAVGVAAHGLSLPDDPQIAAAVAGYEDWAHANCGYQTVDLMAMDYEFQDVPETLAAGPTSFSLMNHSERGEFHVATLARLRPGSELDLKQLIDLTPDQIIEHVELVPASAAAAPGTTAGLLVDLTPGHYFLLCPTRTEQSDPTSAHLLRGMLAEFDVA